jgi:hopanoid biosynthesis associated RND transporter like protein HpnN
MVYVPDRITGIWTMLKSRLALIVGACTRHAWTVIAVAMLVAIVAGAYGARHFALDTDIGKLISPELPWRQRELAFLKAFPQRIDTIFAVVDAPTSELAGEAATLLAQKLSEQKTVFQSVEEPSNSSLFVRNGLLFLPTEELAHATGALTEAEPVLKVLVTDPSLRGLVQAMAYVMAGIDAGRLTLDQTARALNLVDTSLENVLAGRPASFSWRELMNGKPPEPMDLRRFIQIRPILDFGALEPGLKATQAIRRAAADLKLDTQYQARVRLTGPVPIQDEEFATLKEGALVNAIGTVVAVLFILWLALKSAKIIFAMFVSMLVGLVVTAALGLWMVGSFNPISIAFAVLFVGIGVDFGIQYSVRYRAERHASDDLSGALANAARNVGAPLTLAAAATAAGFFSFLPTAYGGFSELGLIAGVGMIVAYVTSLTLLPSLLKVLNPPGEKEPVGYQALAPIDRFTERHRIPIIIGTLGITIAGLPLLYFLQFDFNPMNLRSAKVESIATYLDLRKDPATGASAIDVLAPSLAAAREMAARLTKVPEVSRVMTLETFIPDDQQAKLALVEKAAAALGPTLTEPHRPAATDADNVAALDRADEFLTKLADAQPGPGADAAKRLAASIARLAKADQAMRDKAETVFVAPLKVTLAGLAELLKAEPVTEKNIPPDFAKDWIKPDGHARVQIYPTGDPNDNEVLRQFARAVLAVEPTATGGPIAILEAGHTVTTAFMQAGATALISIAILLFITLRRISDVLLTLIPLLVAGVVTLEICVLIGMKLNFANIIALPLLLGVGVAFKIYYIMAWRAGQTGLLESSLTRAVIFSALTTATAFGSLWLSSHPGTSSMGKLLALTLVCTLFAAVLFQPLLMGRPREIHDS